jgi:O-antigen ligase
MIAMPHLIFLTLSFLAALVAWALDTRWPWTETAAAIPAVIVAGLTGGLILGAWL